MKDGEDRPAGASSPDWMAGLAEEDRQLIKRFILCSGSLKDLAAEYGISYPTMRLRLDRLIEKIKVLDASEEVSPFRRKLRLLVADGVLDAGVARTILREHEKTTGKAKENGNG